MSDHWLLREAWLPSREIALDKSGAAASAARRARSISCSISRVPPCLNAAKNLDHLFALLSAKLAGLAPPWETVAVDDGSTEKRVLQLSRDFGKRPSGGGCAWSNAIGAGVSGWTHERG
ncbi:hypothetical protein GCM10010975_00660 [Comamonas phosphati]|nr:hypothetical protein GCM10010975_00660 [Comamonas phosphati]